MGLFDELKNKALNSVNDVLNQTKDNIMKTASDAINQVKDDAMQSADNAINEVKHEAEEKIASQVERQGAKAINNGINNYLDNAYDKVPTEDGKEAVATLKDMVKTTQDIYNSGGSEQYTEEATQELQKLADIADKYNNQ